jgi:hypothetical protein
MSLIYLRLDGRAMQVQTTKCACAVYQDWTHLSVRSQYLPVGFNPPPRQFVWSGLAVGDVRGVSMSR